MPLDFTIWEMVKQKSTKQEEKMIKNKTETRQEFQARLRKVGMRLGAPYLSKVWNEMKIRFKKCHDAGGGHFDEGGFAKNVL